MNFVVNLNFMTQMTARDSKHINAAMNASAFSRRETREQVSVRSTQIGWQRNGKLRSITVRTTASVAQKTTQSRCRTSRTILRRHRRQLSRIPAPSIVDHCFGNPSAICSICLGGALHPFCKKNIKIWRRNTISVRLSLSTMLRSRCANSLDSTEAT